jgi:hypothetical protein
VGGPDTAGGAGGKFPAGFLEHCLRGTNYATGKTGTPIDFLSFHAKGAPKFVEGHVQMGIANQLRTIDGAMAVIASFPELKTKPIVIGESDPEGCAACQGPQLGYRNGTMYSSYTAASFARKHDLAAKHGVNLEGALTWAFEFEDQPYFAGFRSHISVAVIQQHRSFGGAPGSERKHSSRDILVAPRRRGGEHHRGRRGPDRHRGRVLDRQQLVRDLVPGVLGVAPVVRARAGVGGQVRARTRA